MLQNWGSFDCPAGRRSCDCTIFIRFVQQKRPSLYKLIEGCPSFGSILSIDVDSSIQVGDNCLHSDRCTQLCRHVLGFVKDGAGTGGTSIAATPKSRGWKYPFENSRE